MASTKNTLLPFNVLATQAVSGATTVTVTPTNIQNLDNVSYQFVATGTLAGTFAVQGSLDYNPGGANHPGPANTGNWVEITNDTISGADVALFDLNQLSFPWIRVVYTNSSGSGNLTGYVSGKAV